MGPATDKPITFHQQDDRDDVGACVAVSHA